MKKVLIILLILISSSIIQATNYYVDNSITDINVGSSTPDFTAYNPVTFTTTGGTASVYKTIADVNLKTFASGDKVLFRKGQVWYETIIPKYSASDLPCTYGAFGTGANPIINGFTTISSGWTNEGGGIYSKVITAESQTNMVLINDVQYAMGRTPNKGSWNTYEVVNSATSVTDNQLTGSPSWLNAEAVLYMNGWELNRCLITNHTTNTITYINLAGSNTPWLQFSGGKYFFQNALQTLDQYGEWYHDYSGTGRLYVYFGAVDPNTKTVKVATLNSLFYNNNGRTYITIRDINFVGCIKDAISSKNSANNYWNVLACQSDYSGLNPIYASGTYCKVDSCTFIRMNRGAIAVSGINATITNNTLSKIALPEGQGGIKDGVNTSTYNTAIWIFGTNSVVQNNIIDSTGYCGIVIHNSVTTSTVKRNYITNTCKWRWDYGGIYFAGSVGVVNTFLVEENVVIGTGGSGIYLDELSNGATVKNNTIANCGINGIKISGARNHVITGNTIFDCGEGIALVNWNSGQLATNVTLTNNISVAKADTTKAFSFVSRVVDYATQVATHTMNNNIYARPHLDTNSIELDVLNGDVSKLKTLTEWQSFSGKDALSKKSPQSVSKLTDIQFEYNATSSPVTKSLNYPSIDMYDNKFTGTVTIPAYSGRIFLKDSSPIVVKSIYRIGDKVMRSSNKLYRN